MTSSFNSICVVGLGYIGLPTAVTIASRGVNVVGVDINSDITDSISRGKAHFFEPDLDILLKSVALVGKLRAVSEPEAADAFIIAVPTPFNADKTANLSYVKAASLAIAKVLKAGDLVILESTSPVGTTTQMCEWISAARPDLKLPHSQQDLPDVNIAYCPERILPGRMLFELVQNDRIVGGMTARCASRASELYRLFVQGSLFTVSSELAEVVKLMENAYRDVNVAFANEISILCDHLGLDVFEAIALANRHPRVNVLNPGPGVGGHCIPVDPWFLISSAPRLTPLLQAARSVNDSKPHFIFQKIRSCALSLSEPVIACLGLTYKPDVDDLRESPAVEVVEALMADRSISILVVEPNIEILPPNLRTNTNIEKVDLQAALERAAIVVLLVGHSAFQQVGDIQLAGKVVIDTVGMWRHSGRDHLGAFADQSLGRA